MDWLLLRLTVGSEPVRLITAVSVAVGMWFRLQFVVVVHNRSVAPVQLLYRPPMVSVTLPPAPVM